LDDWVNGRSAAKALISKTRASAIATAISMYAADHHALPPSLGALVPSYLPEDQADSWSRPFIYTLSEDGFATLTDLGADGKTGGSGPSTDFWWQVSTGGSIVEGEGAPPLHNARARSKAGR
jgi:hypothetical protein